MDNDLTNEITREDVTSLSKIVGINVDDSEIDEVTYRLAALQRELRKLDRLDLRDVEAIPLFHEKGE